MRNNRVFAVLFMVGMLFIGLALAGLALSTRPAQAQTNAPVFVGAGDIANCGRTQDESTAALLDGISGTVFTLGDHAYPDGTSAQFRDCYGPNWGRHKARTRPSPGNHDYHTAGAAGYYAYFGSAASPLDNNCTSNCKGYYSYNLGDWHIIALNSEIDHAAGSAQEQWLRADLAANQKTCTLAYWHKPFFSSGQHGNIPHVRPFWDALYQYGADVVLGGHDHTYERFAPQNPSGQADANRGIRQFVVGTGGASLYPFPTVQPNSQARNNTVWGVLKLTLQSTSYSWQFVPVAGQSYTDSGTANCVGAGSNPTPTRTATPGPSPTPTRTPTPQGTAMHVGDLDGSNTNPGGRWTASVTITIHNSGHSPLSNATVSGSWSNGASGSSSCTTDSNGRCSVTKSGIRKNRSNVTFTVTGVTRSSYAYTPSGNHDPDGDSDGTRIVVRR